ncbi:MAG: ABC transporter substrate-binding protein, partial [Rhizobiales bacterium 35-66-30]
MVKLKSGFLTSAACALGLSVAFALPAAAQDISIGVNMPLTGAFAASGNFVADGAKLAAEEINAKGGVLGKKLNLIIEDNKSNPTEAAAVAEKLIVRDK